MTYTFGHHSNFEPLNIKSDRARNYSGFHTLIQLSMSMGFTLCAVMSIND